jgi:hypothetical protein
MFNTKNWYKCYFKDILFETLPTNAYCSDVSYTASICRIIIAKVKARLATTNQVLTIVQKDKVVATLTSVSEFDNWLNNEYK